MAIAIRGMRRTDEHHRFSALRARNNKHLLKILPQTFA
nr:MAG TPA: hypothetical protein [Bacteriophage sp.]